MCVYFQKDTKNTVLKETADHIYGCPSKETTSTEEKVMRTGKSVKIILCDVACRIQKALDPARRGQIGQVEELCTFFVDKREHDCLFATAEKLVSTGGVQHYNTGVEICRLAESFSTNCQNHLIQQLAKTCTRC